MKNYIKADAWKIIEEGFEPELNKISESIFSLGNGRMGQRANFEEAYSGETLQGNYVAGVYYNDKTRVGWWKNGYPEYFSKVINAANWIGIDVVIDGVQLDLAKCEVSDFRRELNMQDGYLKRTLKAKNSADKQVEIESIRFCSMVDDETGAIKYSITPLNFSGELVVTPFIDGDVKNQDANYDEKFWEEISKESCDDDICYIQLRTKKTGFEVATGMKFDIAQGGKIIASSGEVTQKDKYIASSVKIEAKQDEAVIVIKYAANLASLNHQPDELIDKLKETLHNVSTKGFETMLAEQAAAWAEKWKHNDIIIDGDIAAQQGIRFNIFQLNQTYTGEDDRLNIGPKGFTGEKYGGVTYWDTEAYCVPFYLATAGQKVSKNLLLYRYKQLPQAYENAKMIGMGNGAALYPMVSINGLECHNEWEITFEELHRNGAMAYAIYNYVRYTGDEAYLTDYGLEVLIGIARFWAQRVSWSAAKDKYVMLGITGPNEYENNVNNNWYTNTLAAWCMEYTMQVIEKVKTADAGKYDRLVSKLNFDELKETEKFTHIIENMFYPYDEEHKVFLQQEGYMDKEQILAKDLPAEDRPLNQKWSWDRILRSCFIKQADVLQGIYFFEDKYDIDTIRRNFDFYEPRTVHESSLSPCVHAILAAKLGDGERAYEFYLRTSRLDLDDYNNDTEDGCHITSMAGTWMAVVEGFGGMRVKDDRLSFDPFLPEQWNSFSFHVTFRGALLKVTVSNNIEGNFSVSINNRSAIEAKIILSGQEKIIAGNSGVKVTRIQIAPPPRNS